MDHDHKDQPTVITEEHNFKYYSQPKTFARIIQNRMAIFGTWSLIGYLGHFFCIIIGLNLYSDIDRMKGCNYPNGDHRNSSIYDTSLILIISYHLIEWVRTILFAVTILLGSNFIPIWYATSLNTIFGIIAYIYVHVQRFNEDGKKCADVQKFRAEFLLAEVIIFWLTFFFTSFPHFFLFIMKKENIEDALKVKVHEEEEEH